jgi:membrane protease YdiL (CAAX protease family)
MTESLVITSRPRSVVREHPIAVFLVLLFAITAVVEIVPMPELVHGPVENVLGAFVPALIVTALVGGRAGLREFLGRCLRWRVRLRWYAAALLSIPLVVLGLAPLLYGTAPLNALADNWPLLFTSFLPTLAFMVVFDNVAEEAGWTGFLFARLQDRWPPMKAALLTAIPSGPGTC